MQKWEYLYTLVENNMVVEINGTRVPKSENPIQYLKRAGMEGWDLAGAIPYDTPTARYCFRLIFKRPLPDE